MNETTKIIGGFAVIAAAGSAGACGLAWALARLPEDSWVPLGILLAGGAALGFYGLALRAQRKRDRQRRARLLKAAILAEREHAERAYRLATRRTR